MKAPVRIRLPLFELSILVVLTAMGWALWELNRISGQQSEYQTSLQTTLQKRLAEQAKDFQTRLMTQEERWLKTWQQQAMSQSNVFKGFFEMQTATELREAYLALADRLQTDAPEIHQALLRYTTNTSATDLEAHQRKRQELKDWLRTLKLRLDSKRLIAKSQELTNSAPNPLSSDLGAMCREFENGLTNYESKAELICTLTRNPAPTSYTITSELAVAQSQVQHLLDLAGQARRDAAKVELPPSPPPEPSAEFKRELAQTENEALKLAAVPAVKDYSVQLQAVFYAIVAAMFGLSLFLITAIYRRVVVERLRFRLYETATENKLSHLGQLAAWLAHEIKQPLTAINAWLWTLQKGSAEGRPEHMGTTAIRKEINRLDQIVKDFLRFTQPAAPKLVPLRPEPVLREVLDLLKPQLERQRIQLNLDPPVKARFSADPQQLKQVLINLVQNAAESIEHDGRITLRARKDKADLKGQASEVVVLEVEDTGPGIPPDVQQRLFDPFFSTKEDGTGLGLPIAANIIDKHGGAIRFRTEVGKGTAFGIVLPILQEAG